NGRRRDARAEGDRARELAKDRVAAILDHGDLLLKLRRLDRAKAEADRAVELAPNSLEALVLRAEVEEAMLDEPAARSDAEQVVKQLATSRKQWQAAVRAYRLIARALVMTNDPNDVKKAAKAAKDATDLDGETMATRLLLYRIQLHPSFTDQ